ncbi:GNAT family N-acetyltransferase [Paenibacillus soyae]|uniref:GNAT family N-acetyltransferase n=1 Tax=Paenibacillus soyae TaxID=2969249 RepID=A0A9X2MP31_9BACL|nr:GNAT family N-acetyltransferase [Paenibacillus soyae]MCR2803221.1 GNAT family N-acetyltransferase [Paenibacillus soyae]
MDLAKRLEEISLNGWPALQTVLYDGWLLRFSNGYTKRSNSVNPIYGHTLGLDEKIKYCEALYASQGQACVFKVTPFAEPAGLDEKLNELGYELVDHTLVKTASLENLRASDYEDMTLATEATPEWLDALAGMQGLNDSQKETTRRMMEVLPLRKAFVMLRQEGIPVACGIVVLEQEYAGLYDIVTDARFRGRGYGEELTRHLLWWAREQGAKTGYLLVVKRNEAANRLYDKFGFEHLYDYWYRVRKS